MKRLSVLALFLAGCAPTRQFVSMPQGPDNVDPEKARVYVVQPKSSGMSFDIYDGEALVGELGAKGYLGWDREAGPAKIQSVGAINRASVDLTVEKGRTYFIRQKAHWFKRSSLRRLDDRAGRALLAKVRWADVPPDVALAARRKQDAMPDFYSPEWRRVSTLSAYYGHRKGWLYQFQHEVPLFRAKRGSTSLEFGVGVYQSAGSTLRVNYADGSEKRGPLDIKAFPVSVVFSQSHKVGPVRAKSGLGFSVYSFRGSVDMRDGTGLYKDSGSGANFLFPVQGWFSAGGDKLQLRMDLLLQVALTKTRFENRFGRITGANPYSGIFIGFSVARRS